MKQIVLIKIKYYQFNNFGGPEMIHEFTLDTDNLDKFVLCKSMNVTDFGNFTDEEVLYLRTFLTTENYFRQELEKQNPKFVKNIFNVNYKKPIPRAGLTTKWGNYDGLKKSKENGEIVYEPYFYF